MTSTCEIKICKDCGEEKPTEEFRSNGRGYLASYCIPCQDARSRARHCAQAEADWRYSLKRRYGITAEEYDEMFERQGGVCAVCGNECPTGRRLSVDHCHKTGEVRGLLCALCNMVLGAVDDNQETLMNLLIYLGGDF